MQVLEQIVIFLKIVFVISAFLKAFTPRDLPHLNLEIHIVRMLYYNASLLLFLYWFNPWRKTVCLEGEERFLVFSFVVLEFIQEMFPQWF
jgi:hypothetical protein